MSCHSFWKSLDEQRLDTLFPTKNNLLVLNDKDTVKMTLEMLHQHDYLSAPVLHGKEVLGVVDCLDIACFIAAEKNVDRVNETHISKVINFSQKDPFVPLYQAGPFSALLYILSNGVHRCPIVDEHGLIVGVISQFDVLNFLADKSSDFDWQLGELGKRTLVDLGIVGNVHFVKDTATVLECLETLAKYKVSAVPLVNEGQVVGTFSISDVRKIKSQSDLESLVSKFMGTPFSWPVMAETTTTFADTVKRLNSEFLHRIWVVDDKNEPKGVVSLTDVMKQIKKFYPLV